MNRLPYFIGIQMLVSGCFDADPTLSGFGRNSTAFEEDIHDTSDISLNYPPMPPLWGRSCVEDDDCGFWVCVRTAEESFGYCGAYCLKDIMCAEDEACRNLRCTTGTCQRALDE